MCIRDRSTSARAHPQVALLPVEISRREGRERRHSFVVDDAARTRHAQSDACLLYTSDAADERSSVDLGGRRIIKKKKTEKIESDARNDIKET